MTIYFENFTGNFTKNAQCNNLFSQLKEYCISSCNANNLNKALNSHLMLILFIALTLSINIMILSYWVKFNELAKQKISGWDETKTLKFVLWMDIISLGMIAFYIFFILKSI